MSTKGKAHIYRTVACPILAYAVETRTDSATSKNILPTTGTYNL